VKTRVSRPTALALSKTPFLPDFGILPSHLVVEHPNAHCWGLAIARAFFLGYTPDMGTKKAVSCMETAFLCFISRLLLILFVAQVEIAN
jgi:hypothetical protein